MDYGDLERRVMSEAEKPVLSFTIHELPKLPNRMLGSHWRTRSSHAKKWHKLVAQWLVGSQPNLAKARIKLVRRSPRSCDYDGLVGSFKPLLDALVKCGVIQDDTMEHIDCEYRWEKCAGKHQHVFVSVYEGKSA
jgi:hypothetical protein